MPPSARKSIKERELFSLTSSLPCASWLKVLLCSPLRYLWMVLMALTVLCVAIQILGVVWQSRNDKIMSEKLLNVRFTIEIQGTLPTEQRDWENLRSSQAPVVEEEVRSQEEGAPKQPAKENQKVAEHQDGRDEPGVERRLQVHHQHLKLSNTFNKVKDSRKEARGKVLAVKAALPKVTLGDDGLHLGVPGSVVLQLGHPAIRVVSTLSHKPLQLPLTNQLKSRNSLAPLGTNSVVAGVISEVKPGIATSTCRPKNHIVFLKTHKTASSTILNILYRYGDSRNLTFALPLNMHSQLFYPFFFASHFVEGVRSRSVKKFHIMCNHMRFRPPEVRKVMPQDTFYFSILKNPVAMMESIFIYYKSIPAFHKARSLDDFLDNGWRSYNTSLPNNHYARNILTFDFGFDNNVATETPGDLETRATTAIGAIEEDFHLILISEYFDESMILLKRALCWSLDDIVSFKLNSRSERARNMLSPHTADKIRAWNALDWRLYLHFNATFWRRVDTTVGRVEMRREVTRLQEQRAKLAKICLKDGGAVDPSQVQDAGLKPFQYGAAIIQGYNLNPGLDGPTKTRCQNLITPELQYTDTLYTKQFPELATKQRQAAKLVASQRQPGPAKVSPNKAAMAGPVRVREARHSRTARSGPRNPNAQNQNDPRPTVLSKITADRSDRNMP
ncbi:galactose-3-O-sulfotransferase 2-like [Salvelinus sp. IW2-2015]|uniref:galactose-3-O-sulfotransferase 2-like n=1 Tax=Salvelinus sp. IW2-2015 TaxID=2691554 RepID=UPI000CDF614A|nr:galactose-3-O-sulfotransferase 2-like [Salvelinus alpinus]